MIKLISLISVISISFFFLNHTTAQFNKPIGAWESHLPQQIVHEITRSDTDIYYSTSLSIVKVNIEEFSVSFFSKVEGLSETGISKIAFDRKAEQLIICYTNGAIDILQKDNTVITIPDFKENKTFVEKDVNKIFITDNRRILYATRFGIISQNADNFFFEFTTDLGQIVYDIVAVENKIYAATEIGIFLFEDDGFSLPGDFTRWKLLDGEVNLPALYNCSQIEFFAGNLYAFIDDDIYRSSGSQWELFKAHGTFEYQHMSSEGKHLLITGIDAGRYFIDAIKENGEELPNQNSCSGAVKYPIEANDGSIWYANNWHGLRVQSALNADCSTTFFNSPYTQKVREIRIKNSNLYVSSGGINESFLFNDNKDGFFIRDNNLWNNINEIVISAIAQKFMFNFSVVEPHPSKNIIYAGAFPGGILELNLDNNDFNIYNSDNSVIQGPEGAIDLERVPELKFDENENLWVLSYLGTNPLHVLTKDGKWFSFKFGNIRNLSSLEFDDFGKIWITIAGSSGGVLVFDHNNTFENTEDDDYVIFNSSNSEINAGKVLSIKKDLEGDIWVGTESGPVIFECGNIFPDKNCRGNIRKVLEDSIPAPLLDTESIITIAVDGANRKWLGTATGIYVQSPDGFTQEFRYTQDNSPLFDDNIVDIEYDERTGEMFIGTIKGIQSIRTESSGATKNFSQTSLYTFPNPVRPEYNGPIAIRGLARDANVKITDIQGRLVHETTSNGGTAIWDGIDYNGKRAASGVYIVYATYTKELDNLSTETTKILFIE